ncbi:hypothetical protein CHS0354_018044 [Potamilus streckersoni]|uniref:K Homology domain-containing protein n=1 Tax=Potamilus streckersoni TaxID=2493646 RepID=A0AAE0VF65_9BIVA|nr:hypothetical protein CHS0354_018044 [Potamilus streckersoni]
MDVLRPPIIRIGDRCYRKNPILQRDVNMAEEEEYTEFLQEEAAWNDEICDIKMNIEETDNGYKLTLSEVPSTFFKFIIGKKGETKKKIETETRTRIQIPPMGKEGDIVITGHDRKGVLSAKTRIDLLTNSARQKEQFTHFLSIPVTSANIKVAMEDFKMDVLVQCDGDRGLDQTIFQNPDKLHLTLATLVLLNEKEINQALEVLRRCQQDLVNPILKGEPLHCHVRGLEYMNDDPAEVDVLYAKVDDDSDRLQMLVDRIVDSFAGNNLMQHQYDRVKLHITVMNTIFRKDPSGTTQAPQRQKNRGTRERESFFATNILKKFGDYNFGDYHINTVHLSQRYSTGPEGYYTCAGSIDLP